MAKVTQKEIIEMNELYLEYKTYAAVAREVGRSPTTVKRYIIPDYISQYEPAELKPIDWKKLEAAPVINIANWEEPFVVRKE